MGFINNKNTIKAALIASFVLLNILLLLGLSNVLEYLNSGADRASMLHLAKETVNTYLPKVIWENASNEGRKMEEHTLKKIEKDYLFSWYVKNKSLEVNKNQGIEDFYNKKARVNLYQSIAYNLQNKITIQSTTIKHYPKLEFYSQDGQQVVFTDKNVIEYQKIFKNKKLVTQIQDTATYKVLMLLEDGFWRVRHIHKTAPQPFVKDSLKINPEFKIVGKKIQYHNLDYTIKGINYYPKNSPWDTFGLLFNTDTIGKDMDIIRNAKLNSIRIFVSYDDFGKADIMPEKIQKLRYLLDLAQQKDLKVIVTLFDFYSDYSLDSWTLTARHAEKIVSEFKNHKAILAWDIKNEPDLDFKNRGKENVINWLQQMITVVKENAPNQLITIGWSNYYQATNLQKKVDFVSYHFYNPINNFEKENTILDRATQKPVVIQEFGLPSYSGFWNWIGNTPNDQAAYYRQMQQKFKKNNLSFMSWTLYDFSYIPDQVAGKWPWQKNKQKHFGFIDTRGKNKPSFKFITY